MAARYPIVVNNNTIQELQTGDSLILSANATMTNPIVTNYTETVYAANTGTAITISLSNGTVQNLTANASTTITLPSSVAGKSFVILLTYSGTNTVAWSGGSLLKWPGNTTPTMTSTAGKTDIFTFYQDGNYTYGQTFGLSY